MKHILKWCFVSLSTLLSLHETNAQTTAIPDPIFEQALIDQNIDSDGTINGQVLTSDISGLTNLNIYNVGINDITGLEDFVSLESLNCGNNNLSSIDVSNQPNLITLDITSNHSISQLDISNNPLLEAIIMNGVAVTSLDLSNAPNLTSLEAMTNNMPTLDVSNNPLLRSLQLTANNLTTLDLSNNSALEILSLWQNNITQLDLSNNPALTQVMLGSNNLSTLDLTNKPNLTSMNVTGNGDPDLKICVDNVLDATNNVNWQKDATAIYVQGSAACGGNSTYVQAVEGFVILDGNDDCIVDISEQGLGNVLLSFESTTDTVYAVSGLDGYYTAYLNPSQVYTCTAIPPTPYWTICPTPQNITPDPNVVQALDWLLQSTIDCPVLEVDIAAPFIRATGGGSNYTVQYCNSGTDTAFSAYVEVEIAPELTVLQTSVPILSQNGNLYTFDIGDVPVFQCNSFTINVIADSTTNPGHTICAEAHIYPDSICIPNYWNGAHLTAEGECQGGVTSFLIENIGAGMVGQLQYFVFEDHVMMNQGSFQLGGGQTQQVQTPSVAGKTYRIVVEQEPGFPYLLGDATATAFVENCNFLSIGHPNLSQGFGLTFSNGSSSPFLSVDCQEMVAAYDPNDKMAQPVGYGPQHYIEQNVSLDYRVRFQNTGNDTAFTVVVLDTISPLLDLSTIQMGASSHAYTWSIIDGNVLRVAFDNIKLPDSTTNEPASNGFFRYRIDQQLDNPLGSVIENSAAIYFDFNPPIITNTAFHTIGENFITIDLISIENVLAETVQVSIAPNPFEHFTTIQIEGQEYQQLDLVIYNAMGQVVKTVSGNGKQLELHRDNLSAGFYSYQLVGDGQLINVGKLIVR